MINDSTDFIVASDDPNGNPEGLPAAWPVIQLDSDSESAAPESPYQRLSNPDFADYLATHRAEFDASNETKRRDTLVKVIRQTALDYLNQWYDYGHLIRFIVWRTDDAYASATGKTMILSVRAWVDSITSLAATYVASILATGSASVDFPSLGAPPYTFDQVYFATYTPTFTANPADALVIVTLPAVFTVTTTGYSTRTYQWQRSNDGGTTWANIGGATSATYTLNPTASGDNGAKFRCKCQTSAYAVATSTAATLTVVG